MKYNAFISYSHAADGKMAPALQTALERFAKPWYKLRNLNIFRDESSLSASPHLWSNIQIALDNSKYLIYMASPESANSKWVNKEIEYWLTIRSLDTLLIVLTDGQLSYNSETNNENDITNNALPFTLTHAFKEEPFYVDCRDVKSETDLTLNNPIFKKDILKIAAQLHGKAPKDLASEEVKVHRKMIWTRNIAVLLLLSLLTYSIISTKNSLKTIEENRKKDIAIEKQNTSIAKSKLEQERLRNQSIKDSLMLIEKEKQRVLADQLKDAREQLAKRMIENTKTAANIALSMNDNAKSMIKEIQNDYSKLQRNFNKLTVEKSSDSSSSTEIVINPIFFDFDKFSLRQDAIYELENTISILHEYPQFTVRIIVPYYFSFIGHETKEWFSSLPNANNIEGFDKIDPVNAIIKKNNEYRKNIDGLQMGGALNPKYHENLQRRKAKSVTDYFISRGLNPKKTIIFYEILFADDVLNELENLKTSEEKQRLLQRYDYIRFELVGSSN
jgi:outer membrane protein OmpA-like peptidoglycan-associated protein